MTAHTEAAAIEAITADYAAAAIEAFRGAISAGLVTTAVALPSIAPALIVRSPKQIADYIRSALANLSDQEVSVLHARVWAAKQAECKALRARVVSAGYEEEADAPIEWLDEARYLEALTLALQVAVEARRGQCRMTDALCEIANDAA